jgi:hypothetical protein
MNKITNMLIAAIAIVAISTNVSAGTTSVGITGSALDVSASGTETDKLTAAGADVADTSVRKKNVSDSTFTGSLFAEYTLSESAWPLSFGFEYTPGTADISNKLSRTDTELSITGDLNTTANSVVRTASADATNFSTAYLEAPIWGMLYVRAGVSNIDINYVTTDTSTVGGSYSDNISLTGTNLGVGLKGNTSGGTLWKMTYEETDYDGFTLNSTGNSVAANSNTIKGDVDTSAFRLSLAKSF